MISALTQVVIYAVYLLFSEVLGQPLPQLPAAGTVTTKRLLNNNMSPTSAADTGECMETKFFTSSVKHSADEKAPGDTEQDT